MAKGGGARLAVLALSVCVLVPLLIFTGLLSSDADNDGLDDFANAFLAGGALRADAPINAAWVPWVNKAGAVCRDITPALVAAQIDVESSWNPDARAVNPPERGGDAMGLAQFQAGTWQAWGNDADGDGTSSPFDPEDAIVAMGALMCDLVRWAREGVGNGSLVGDLLDVALAAYNCGRGCVTDARGVPAAGQAHEYPVKVRATLPKYAAPPAIVVGGWALPLPKGRFEVGSGFGLRGGRLHAGVDLMAARETQVLAASAGTVIIVKCDSTVGCAGDGSPAVRGCGWYVDIRHAAGVITRYCHQIREPTVKVGDQVAAGQQIGWVGSTGNSSGPHLHFEVHLNNDRSPEGAVDPIAFLRTAGLDP